MSSECPASSHRGECPVQINPANNMPMENTLQGSSTDEVAKTLSCDREISTIPRADTESTWQYPSARMFYNALYRKSKPVSADAIPSMLAIHNGLNEQVWQEIVQYEKYLNPKCVPKLKRFMGRPEKLSPRAWWHVKVRGGEAPFDRHDWFIERCDQEVRYVIDYYSGHPETGLATFSVDIRPALDSPQSFLDRFRLFLHK